MSKDTPAKTRVVGTLRSVNGTGVVRMEDLYDTDIDDLWSALTDPLRLARWIADVEGDLRLGGEFRASFTSGWEGPGRVDVCEPPRRLLLTMEPGRTTRPSLRPSSSPMATRPAWYSRNAGSRSTSWPRTGPAGRRTSRTSPLISWEEGGVTGGPVGPSSPPPIASRPVISPERPVRAIAERTDPSALLSAHRSGVLAEAFCLGSSLTTLGL